ncbi:MAG TPA: amidase, partial [Solirubrobacteraceae bacterium]
MTDLARADAISQAALVRDGSVTAGELTEAAIDRVRRLDPALGFLVEPLFERALEAARSVDRGEVGGPLAGAPMLLKDHLATIAGVRHTEGSAFLRDYVAAADSELVSRYRRAGLVIIGTASTPEFALMSTTEPRLHGPTRNPWDTARSPGGSSGASAAAVAAGVVPVAHGNDSGGSLRIPASCCGVFGLKPTRARNSLAPYGDLGGIWVEHVITRSVRDSAAVLDATCGPAGGDPYAAPPGAGPFRVRAEADPDPLRLAFTASPPGGYPVAGECIAAVEAAADLCAGLGHTVEETAPALDWATAEADFLTVFSASCAAWVDGWSRRLGREPGEDELEPYTVALAAAGRRASAPELLACIERLQEMARAVDRFFERYDVLLTPTLAEPAPPLGYFDPPPPPGDPLEALERDARFTPFTWVANATGQPAASLPMHWSAEGLPVGVMAAARVGGEGTLLALAAQL